MEIWPFSVLKNYNLVHGVSTNPENMKKNFCKFLKKNEQLRL